MTLSRREVLQLLGAAGASTAVAPGCGGDDGDAAPSFLHGVASGDPTADAVILWTRVTPAPGAPPASIEVTWEVSTSADFASPARRGTFTTNAERDWTVKVDATGLQAGTGYHYRFRAGGVTSPVGRAKTAASGSLARARFAVCSCSSFAHGYFHAYRRIAARDDLDAVIHLGDYVYEYGNNEYGSVRPCEPPTEIRSLDDYRKRYAQYRRDPDLQAAHARHAFITVWDDHEFADNAWSGGAENHTASVDGSWADRRRAAARVYMEWMPIREQADGRIYRRLRFGDLVDLVLLDTRVWGREEQANNEGAAMAPGRQLLGAEQERWFFEQVTASTARWKLVGQQVMMAQLSSAFLNTDQWDGYAAARTRFLTLLRSMRVNDVVVLTGDIHSSWAADLVENPADPMTYDPASGRGSLAVEFVVPSITSPGLPPAIAPLLMNLLMTAPHFKYAEGTLRGYVVLDVTGDRAQAAWYYVGDVTRQAIAPETFGTAWSVARGENRLRRDMAPAT